jgi:hypothetical protein
VLRLFVLFLAKMFFFKFPGQNVSLVWSFGVTWAQSNPAGLTASRSYAVSSARLLLAGAQRERQLFNYDLVIIRAVGSVSGREKT